MSEAQPSPTTSGPDRVTSGQALPAIESTLRALDRAVASSAPLLIVGELGSGKKTTARSVHERSRPDTPLVLVHGRDAADGRWPTELREAVERAADGTLILDGIDGLASSRQGPLARALDCGLRPRIVSTSRVEPRQLVRSGRLLPEIYFHLGVLEVALAPLRERRGELPLLARRILDDLADRWRLGHLRLDESAEQAIRRAPWPGNLRQLNWALQRAAASSTDGRIRGEDLELSTDEATRDDDHRPLSLAEVERATIARALTEVGGHRRRAAALLGIGLRTLYDKLKRYDLH